MQKHCPKKHLDFENPIKNPNVTDTSARVYGEKQWTEFGTTTSQIGAGKNVVSELPKTGLKKQNVEAEVSDKNTLNIC